MIRIGIYTGRQNTQAYRKAIEKVDDLKLVGEFRQNHSNNRPKNPNGHKIYTDFSNLMEDCDAILFLNYSHGHFDALVKAVKSSKHIFFESIHNLDLLDARELMKLAAEANVIFKIGLKESCFACMQEIKSDFENPLLIESFINKKNSHNTQYNILDNEIVDIIFQCLNLIKGNVKRLSASCISVNHEFDDVVHINLEFDNGSVATFSASLLHKKESNKLILYKHGKFIHIDLIKNNYLLRVFKQHHVFRRNFLKSKKSKINQLQDFMNSIEKHSTTTCSIEYGVKVLEVIQKIKEKMRITSNQM